jgi:D-alanyl-D-alanine carboxypeptidase
MNTNDNVYDINNKNNNNRAETLTQEMGAFGRNCL